MQSSKPIELSPVDIYKLETGVERITGLLAATAAHLDRSGFRELGDLIRLGQEDARLMRETLIAKGAISRPVSIISASDIASNAVRNTLNTFDHNPPMPAFLAGSAEAA